MAKYQRPNPREHAQSRLRIVEGIIVAIDAGGRLVDAIHACPDRVAARDMLVAEPWSFDVTVASHILDLPFGRTTELARRELAVEADELRRQLDEFDQFD